MSFHEFLLSLFTLFLVVVGVFQFRQMQRTNDSAAVVERAYVKISHTDAALRFQRDLTAIMQVRIRNHGRTPTTVTEVLIEYVILPSDQFLPNPPVYGGARTRRAGGTFLVTEDEFFWTPIFPSITAQELAPVMQREAQLWVFGYVDYIDKFGHRHRGGYGRVYRPDIGEGGNNLVFDGPDTHNYDREREIGEGNDW
jgi:hypothetical protein